MICKKCGNEIPNEAKICGYCGTEVVPEGVIYNGIKKGDYLPPTQEELSMLRPGGSNRERDPEKEPEKPPVEMINYQAIRNTGAAQSRTMPEPSYGNPAGGASGSSSADYAYGASGGSDAQYGGASGSSSADYAYGAPGSSSADYAYGASGGSDAQDGGSSGGSGQASQEPRQFTFLSPEYHSAETASDPTPTQFQNTYTYAQTSYDFKSTEEGTAKGISIASLVLGIVGFPMICCMPWMSLVLALVGLVLGIVGIVKADQSKGMAIAGLICSIVDLLLAGLMVVLLVFSISGLRVLSP